MKKIDRTQLQQEMQDDPDLKVIEVLSEEDYEAFHIPGAMNVPLNEHFGENIQKAIPNKEAHVAVYCANTHCQASEKAAEQMEELGYRDVEDYAAGKEDWRSAGLMGKSGREQ